jgi:uracil-DNA glycosylase
MSTNIELSELISDLREQVLFLQELGVDALEVGLPPVVDSGQVTAERGRPAGLSAQPRSGFENRVEKAPPPDKLALPRKDDVAVLRASGSRLAALPSLKDRKAAPVRKGSLRQVPEAQENQAAINMKADEAAVKAAAKLEETTDTIESIRAEIGNCLRCPLHEGRTQVVHTTGNFQAELMFVGEAPGADEDEQGFPFVGRAGQLLTKIIEGMGYKREDVVIGNINRCRPPGNRAPTLPEAHTCRPFLLREIAVIKPKVIVVMGNTALHNLLDTKAGITKVRGEFQDYFGVKVMPTFHPAFLLRDPRKKREVWEDMKKVRDFLAN